MTRFSPSVRNLSTRDNLISQFLPNSRIINKFSLNSHKILTKFHKLLQILTKFSPNSTSSSKFLQNSHPIIQIKHDIRRGRIPGDPQQRLLCIFSLYIADTLVCCGDLR